MRTQENPIELQARTTQYIEQPRPLASRKGGQYDTHEYGFKSGYCFGFTFLLLFLCLFCLEVARIFTGSLNRRSDGNYQLYPSNIYLPPMYNSNSSYNVERQNHYLWLWSSPALFLGIPVLLASIFGFTAAKRATYSMIYLLFLFSLIAFFISPFLIGYYSSNASRHNSDPSWNADWNKNRDRILSILLLVTSIILTIISFIAIIMAGIGFDCCRRKGGSILTPVRRCPY